MPSPHLPVDYLFRSLAEERQAHSIAVVLSGTGADGTLGLCEIKAVGGITFAQDEESAQHAGMPQNAVESGCVDFVLSPPEIARQLATIAGHPYLAAEAASHSAENDDEIQFQKILGTVRAVAGIDFSQYRDTTLKRRIMRRMALHFDCTVAQYAKRLESDGEEVDSLYHDLLINVTSFFRDPGTV